MRKFKEATNQAERAPSDDTDNDSQVDSHVDDSEGDDGGEDGGEATPRAMQWPVSVGPDRQGQLRNQAGRLHTHTHQHSHSQNVNMHTIQMSVIKSNPVSPFL